MLIWTRGTLSTGVFSAGPFGNDQDTGMLACPVSFHPQNAVVPPSGVGISSDGPFIVRIVTPVPAVANRSASQYKPGSGPRFKNPFPALPVEVNTFAPVARVRGEEHG